MHEAKIVCPAFYPNSSHPETPSCHSRLWPNIAEGTRGVGDIVFAIVTKKKRRPLSGHQATDLDAAQCSVASSGFECLDSEGLAVSTGISSETDLKRDINQSNSSPAHQNGPHLTTWKRDYFVLSKSFDDGSPLGSCYNPRAIHRVLLVTLRYTMVEYYRSMTTLASVDYSATLRLPSLSSHPIPTPTNALPHLSLPHSGFLL